MQELHVTNKQAAENHLMLVASLGRAIAAANKEVGVPDGSISPDFVLPALGEIIIDVLGVMPEPTKRELYLAFAAALQEGVYGRVTGEAQ